jgi:hypothetical protein
MMVVPLDRLGQVAFRREQWGQLGSNHHENRAMGEKGETTHVTSAAFGKEERPVHL